MIGAKASKCLVTAGLVAFCGLLTSAARADAEPAAVAEALFEQARHDMRQGNYAAACPKLVESQRIDPANGTLFNLMLCEEQVGKVASAWLHAKELSDRLPLRDDRRPIVEQKLAVLSARLPKLTVRLPQAAPADTKVTLDGVEIGPTSMGIAVPIDPGVHRLVVSAPGYEVRAAEISLRESSEQEFLGEPGPLEKQAFVPVAPAAEPVQVAPIALPPNARPNGSAGAALDGHSFEQPPPKWVGWTATGVGAAGLVAGAVMGALALNRLSVVHDVCPDKQCRDQSGIDAGNQGRAFVVGSIIGLAVGAVGLGVGVYVLTRSDDKSESPAVGQPTPSGALVTYGASF